MIKENSTICFFGIYNPEYSRNRVLMSGLKQNGVEIIECRSDKKGLLKYFDLIKKHWRIRKDYDVLLVAFPGFQTMILARFLTRKKIIFDCFAPLYESEVFDRKNTKKGSLKAKYFWLLDKFSARLADVVLLDTNEQIKYLVEEFGIRKEKFERVFVGSFAQTFLFTKAIKKNDKFVVSFYGFGIPLQGLKYILKSADKLKDDKDIVFNIIGSKIKRRYGKKELLNINFIEDVPYEKLLELISQSDICLGIFGDTQKTQRVIPNKVFDCAALKKPVITADTPAIRELFDKNDLYLIPTADSEALAEAILKLKNDAVLREKLAKNGYNKFASNCTPNILGKQLINIINGK